MPTHFDRNTNLAELPFDVAQKLYKYLNAEANWNKITQALPETEKLRFHTIFFLFQALSCYLQRRGA